MAKRAPNQAPNIFDTAIRPAAAHSGSVVGTNQASAAKLQATLIIFADAEAAKKSWPKNLTSKKTKKLPTLKVDKDTYCTFQLLTLF